MYKKINEKIVKSKINLKEKFLKNKKTINYIILIIVGCILCIPLLNSQIDVYSDDGIQHIARAFGTWTSIKQNGVLPNVINSFTNNFGYSWNLFYGSLSTYVIIFINLIFNNFIIIIIFIINVIS